MTPGDHLKRAPLPSRTHLEPEVDGLYRRIAKLELERDAAEAFAALAAHELVAPLVMTEACAALAAEQLDPAEHADLLQAFAALGRGSQRTRHLVEWLLHEARASGRPLRQTAVDLGALAHECIEMLTPEIRARSARIVVGPLPVVRGEGELLGGLLTNLVTNALKFNPRQGGTVIVAGVRDDDEWIVQVDSEGPLIAPEDRERIFEPFYRGQRERRIRGAGLGLAICRRIVERHGGRIGVVAAGAETNRFVFTLPAA
jgi:chemotaxis family two-component system sensor kinase Cph1